MAEAHSAVAISFAVTHEGFDVNFDWHVTRLVLNAAARSFKKRAARFKNSVQNGVYPASVQSLAGVVAVVAILLGVGFDPSRGYISWIDEYIVRWFVSGGSKSLYLSGALFGLVIWWSFILLLRYTLKLLFVYKGWMYEPRGGGKPISKKSKLWLCLVKILAVRKPMLYSFQGSLPGLPVPSVENTMSRYLRSVRPFLNDEKYARMEKLAAEFKDGIARKLQRYLVLKSWFTSNYVSDWWEEYVYLRGRAPIMVNSNFYGMDTIFMKPTNIPAARAGNMIHFCLQFRRAIERQELEPIMLQGTVPLCSWQYERVFNTCRIPGVETDKVLHLHDSSHIAVYYSGCWYKVIIHYKGRLLQPCEIESQMQTILDSNDEPSKGEAQLGALTAGDRVTWARARQAYFSKGINRASLDCIEKAAFVVVFDREDFNFDMKDPNYLDHFGRALLHGKGYDRWFDKSFNLIFGSNGRVGFNAEHSWADAAIMSHVWEFVMSEDVINQRYMEDGHCTGRMGFEPPAPIRLKWDIGAECLDVIGSCVQGAQSLLSDVDLRILLHNAYGKGFMKTCKVSPDAYLQMALQLAYFRDSGKFCLTYEASMTRLFREGRTETVRPCTVEASAWVRSMEDDHMPSTEKIKMLLTACNVHQHAYQDAMCGKGIDRHLFCLYVISKYLELDSPFLKEVLSEPWRLSTSQTPHGQTQKLDLKKHPNCISAGGGFGPVADDGYGVSYIIAGEDMVFFHISSKKSSPETDSSRFARQIERALHDMKALFLNK